LDTLKLAFTRIADQRQVGLGIHPDAVHRTGVHTDGTAIAAIFVQLNPVFPAQRIVGAGGNAFVVFASQANTDGRNFGPIRFHMDPGTFGGALAKMAPGADSHADLTFGAKRAF